MAYKYKISRMYHFESGHFLPNVRDGHKCKRQHGHNYRMEVTVSGELDQVGFVIDFWDLDDLVQQYIAVVDHRNLNDVSGLENPTAEYIASWFFWRIKSDLRDHPVHGVYGDHPLHLECVTIWETPECSATFSGEQLEESKS